MSFSLSLSQDSANALLEDMLVQDHALIKSTVEQLSSKQDLTTCEMQDLTDNQRWLAAMETLLEYYLTQQRFREVVGRDL